MMTNYLVVTVVLVSACVAGGAPPGGTGMAWGPDGCAPVGAIGVVRGASVQVVRVAMHGISGWREGRTREGRPCWYWWRDGQVIAGWCPATNSYRTFDGRTWSESFTPPWDREGKKPDCDCCGDDCSCTQGKPRG